VNGVAGKRNKILPNGKTNFSFLKTAESVSNRRLTNQRSEKSSNGTFPNETYCAFFLKSGKDQFSLKNYPE
jgi:hypothetical protein